MVNTATESAFSSTDSGLSPPNSYAIGRMENTGSTGSLNEIKIDLLAKASEDAKTRAETIAKNSGGSLGGIKKATMGVFQITGKNANEDYSYGGAFNTSSKEKTASITLKVDYLAD